MTGLDVYLHDERAGLLKRLDAAELSQGGDAVAGHLCPPENRR